ncbi:MAG: ABC transporter permease [Nitrososphaerota archaeon]|jgi:simple sugar transport system permease protein|nr:ABC transporter permease [Nitrososphaerota archaeon]MDG7041327.1 ABC transporter permease [Nitrososphaerota archaeon]MDG7045706.1 ABC transporter permease [Nitrososphaerota archaeon]
MAVILGMPVRAAPIFAAALGENVDQQAGTLNLGVEGMMLLGTIVGLAVLVYTGSYLLAFLIAGLSAVLLGLFHGLVTITLKADQVVSGTAIWFIGWGLSGYIYTALFKTTEIVVKPVPDIYIPYLTNLPYIGKFLFGEDPVIYLLLIAGIGINFFLYHTKGGLNLRTVGEDPLVAEIMGVNPTLYRYAAIIFGGFMAGIGGAYLTISIVGAFEFDMTAGMGFIAVALVYFAKWKPYRLLLGSLAFGAVYVFYLTIESYLPSIPYQFFEMLPYIVTMVLILYVGSRAHAPAALAMPYIKEG